MMQQPDLYSLATALKCSNCNISYLLNLSSMEVLNLNNTKWQKMCLVTKENGNKKTIYKGTKTYADTMHYRL